jgi:hypothetical protein
MRSPQLILSQISKAVVAYKNNPTEPLTLKTGEIVKKLFPSSRATDSNLQEDDELSVLHTWNDGLPRTRNLRNASADVKRTADEFLFFNFLSQYINTYPLEFPKDPIRDLSVALNYFILGVTNIKLIVKTRIDKVIEQSSKALKEEAEKANNFNRRLRLLLYAKLLDSLDLREFARQRLAGAVLLLPAIHDNFDLLAIPEPEATQVNFVDDDDSKSNKADQIDLTSPRVSEKEQSSNQAIQSQSTVSRKRHVPDFILNLIKEDVRRQKIIAKRPSTARFANVPRTRGGTPPSSSKARIISTAPIRSIAKIDTKPISNQLTMLIFTMMQ